MDIEYVSVEEEMRELLRDSRQMRKWGGISIMLTFIFSIYALAGNMPLAWPFGILAIILMIVGMSLLMSACLFTWQHHKLSKQQRCK